MEKKIQNSLSCVKINYRSLTEISCGIRSLSVAWPKVQFHYYALGHLKYDH